MKQRKRRQLAYSRRGFRIGHRCPDYMPGCIVCDSWAYYDQYQRWPTLNEMLEKYK